jgi:hypothetical protein
MLRHDGEREIVPITAFVAHLEGVVAGEEGRAIGQVAEGPADRRRRGVADDGEAGPSRKCGRAFRAKEKLSPLVIVTPLAATWSALGCGVSPSSY